jgi:serine/threonine protein phosphatase PrpC
MREWFTSDRTVQDRCARVMVLDTTCGYASTRGIKEELRDAVIVSRHIRPDLDAYGVCDSQNGRSISLFFCFNVLFELQQSDVEFTVDAVTALFRRLAARVLEKDLPGTCTAVVALVRGSTSITAHVGNARALLIDRAGAIRCKTRDHTPTRRAEYERIHQARGVVVDGMAGGTVPVSRAFGKANVAGVGSEPDVAKGETGPDDKWLVLATDAVTQWVTTQCIGQQVVANDTAKGLAYTLRNLAFAADSDDSITVVVVDLAPDQPQ